MSALILNQEGHLRAYFLPRMVVLATAFLPNLPFAYSILTLSPKWDSRTQTGVAATLRFFVHQSLEFVISSQSPITFWPSH